MTESLRDLKLRIKSIEKTQKITRAMEMVSSAKLSRVKAALFLERPYFTGLEAMFGRLLTSARTAKNPFFDKRAGTGKAALCVITSDSGLCSVYNYAMIRFAENFINSRGRDNVALIVVGREGFNYFKKYNFSVINQYMELYGRYSDEISKRLYSDMTGLFLRREIDEAYIGYTHFTSTLRLKPTIEKFLNLERKVPPGGNIEYIIEPDMETLTEEMARAYLSEKIRLVLLDAFTSEHASRMIAMKMATDNARDLIDTLTLLRNKARQAAITKDILEVVMSAEALKGQ